MSKGVARLLREVVARGFVEEGKVGVANVGADEADFGPDVGTDGRLVVGEGFATDKALVLDEISRGGRLNVGFDVSRSSLSES